MPKFIPGTKLSELFYRKAIAPLLKERFPNLKYTAALTGSGSEVLGYDTKRSMDHGWGPRAVLFLSEADYNKYRKRIDVALSKSLPYTFMGHSTNYDVGIWNTVVKTRVPVFIKKGKINHGIQIFTIKQFFKEYLSFDLAEKIPITAWLYLPQQKLLTLHESRIFRDELNLGAVLKRFEYYPKDIWLHLLSSEWEKIGQEEAFVARASSVGDELGSKIIATRIVNELMWLCFLMERRYAPYSKWFGTAFRKLYIAKRLAPILNGVLEADSIEERERWLSKAYEIVARKHNSLRITKKMHIKVSSYHNRPYLVIHASKFSAEIRAQIKNKKIRSLPPVGSIDQFLADADTADIYKMVDRLKTIF